MMALIEKGRSRFTDSAQSVMIPRERKHHCVTTFFCRLLRLSPAGRSSALPGEVATTNTFGYNVRSEVTSAAMGTNTYGYVFDPIGNRITVTNNTDVTAYTANGLNQYTAISNGVPIVPVHDDDGNMLTNGVWAYTWDGENRLRSVVSNDVLLVTYTYDHRSCRISKTVLNSSLNTQHSSFIYDGWNLIQETSGTNSTHYVWGLDLSGSLQGAGGVGGLLAVLSPLPLGEGQGEGSTVYLPCYDANGNICEYSSTDGTIVAHYEYSPFGETVIQSGDLADAFSFRFSTKYWETEAGLYYYGFRFYAPGVGRWLNRDPVFSQANDYLSVANSPTDFIDYLGLSETRGISNQECETAKKSEFAANPELYKLYKLLVTMDCLDGKIECTCCLHGEGGRIDPKTIRVRGIEAGTRHYISLCENNLKSQTSARVALRHELQHAAEICLEKFDPPNSSCQEFVCFEVRARVCSGMDLKAAIDDMPASVRGRSQCKGKDGTDLSDPELRVLGKNCNIQKGDCYVSPPPLKL